MKALLDEQLDFRMKGLLQDLPVQVFSPHDLGWLGLKNGTLLETLNNNDFQFLVTADKNMPFQQNLQKVRFTIVLLDLPSLSWKNQMEFGPKLAGLFTNPPQKLPLIIHFSASDFSSRRKQIGLINLVGAENILFL